MKTMNDRELKTHFSAVLNNKKNLEFYINSWVKDSEFDKVIEEFESIDMEKWQSDTKTFVHATDISNTFSKFF